MKTADSADVENGIITVDDTGEPPVVTPPTGPLHPNLVWPTASGITEEEARRICELPIRRSPAYGVCSDIAEQSMDVITESCMLDLLVPRLVYLYLAFLNLVYCKLRYNAVRYQTFRLI